MTPSCGDADAVVGTNIWLTRLAFHDEAAAMTSSIRARDEASWFVVKHRAISNRCVGLILGLMKLTPNLNIHVRVRRSLTTVKGGTTAPSGRTVPERRRQLSRTKLFRPWSAFITQFRGQHSSGIYGSNISLNSTERSCLPNSKAGKADQECLKRYQVIV